MPSLGSSRAFSGDGIDRGKLRGVPVKMALKLGMAHFAARKRHGLENPLVPESRILILLLRGTVALARIFLVGVTVLFSHKQE